MSPPPADKKLGKGKSKRVKKDKYKRTKRKE
jgi:hypothetical protein